MKKQFCPYCGTKLDDCARFCKNCGEAIHNGVEELQKTLNDPFSVGNSTERTTVYEGYIHKCPNCGEVLGSMNTVCPACGYEIRNSGASLAAKEFSEKLCRLSSVDQKISLVQSFPIPNTKEDVYDFLILTAGNLNSLTKCVSIWSADTAKEQMALAAAWYGKLHQCYQKASILLRSDGNFEQLQHVCAEADTNYKTANTRWRAELAKADKQEAKRQQRETRIRTNHPPIVILQDQSIAKTQVWKNKWTSFALCLLLGYFGAHKFYEGKIGTGFLYLFTFGLFGVGWIVDTITLLCKPNPYMILKKK